MLILILISLIIIFLSALFLFLKNKDKFKKLDQDYFPIRNSDKFKLLRLYPNKKWNYSNLLKIHQLYCTLVLKKVSSILNKKKIKYSIWAGTLLGAVREGKFIDHDDDIDIVIFKNIPLKKFQKIFKKYNLDCWQNKYKNCYKVGIPCLKYDCNTNDSRAGVDIFYPKKKSPGELKYCYPYNSNNCWDLKLKDIFPLKKIKFENYKFTSLNSAEKYLLQVYGKDWKIPTKTHTHWNSNVLLKTNLKKIKFILKETK